MADEGNRPLISIGMPVFNCENTVAATITSIVRQTYENWELIIIDDGSRDETMRIASNIHDERIRLFYSDHNIGLAARLNQAVRLSHGTFFARMDGDDIAYPQRLERQAAFLEANPEVDLVGASMLVFDNDGNAKGKRIFPAEHSVICQNPIRGFALAHPTFLGRRDWFMKNGYDPGYKKAEDQEMLLRMHVHSNYANLPEILLGYREHEIRMDKLLENRRYYSKALLSKYWRERRVDLLLLSLIFQSLKTVYGTFAVLSGLDKKMLGHRAMEATSAEVMAWNRVWQSLES